MANVEWGEYKISELFQQQKITNMLSKKDLANDFCFPAYSSESTNNGIIGYTDSPEFLCNDEHPVFVTFGDHTCSFNIATKSFSVLDNVKVLLPRIHNINCLLWIITTWKKQIPNLGYARHWKLAKNSILELPSKDGEIDFDFMESFVAELEAQRVAELEAYLIASGLDSYELTLEENNVLEEFKSGSINFLEFKFIDIFDNIKQGRRLKKDNQIPGTMPFVMSGITNNGVVGYISNPVAKFPKNSITIDIFGNTYYRNYDYGAGDDTGVYWSNKDYSKEVMLFFTTAMAKAVHKKFSYGKKLRSSQSLNFKMLLPCLNDVPDYKKMASLITAIQKLVIKDVVDYADKKIKNTNKVIKKAL